MTRGYRPVLASIAASGWANSVLLLAFAWVVLEATEDPFLVALVFAVHWLPRLFLGLPAGALASDPRRRTWMMVCAAGGSTIVLSLALGIVATSVSAIFVASVAIGCLDSVRGTLAQTAAYDSAVNANPTSALAMSNLSITLSRGLGSLSGGAALAYVGVGATFWLAATGYAVSILVLATFKDPLRAPQRPVAVQALIRSARATAAAVIKYPGLRALTTLAVSAEVLAYSSIAVMPAFARDVLGSGPTGLGILLASKSIGSAVGLVGLARSRSLMRRDPKVLLATVTTTFGLLTAALGLAPLLMMAVIICIAIGVMSGLSDTLLQSQLQSTSISTGHGGGLGIWVWAVGFGPIGQVEAGLLAVVISVQAALIINGAAFALIAVAVAPSIIRQMDRRSVGGP